MIPGEAVEAAQLAVVKAMIAHGPNGRTDGYEEITRAALEAAVPYLKSGADKELEQATRMVATLVLKAGGKASLSARDLTDDFTVLTTTPNVITGGLDIEVFQK